MTNWLIAFAGWMIGKDWISLVFWKMFTGRYQRDKHLPTGQPLFRQYCSISQRLWSLVHVKHSFSIFSSDYRDNLLFFVTGKNVQHAEVMLCRVVFVRACILRSPNSRGFRQQTHALPLYMPNRWRATGLCLSNVELWLWKKIQDGPRMGFRPSVFCRRILFMQGKN